MDDEAPIESGKAGAEAAAAALALARAKGSSLDATAEAFLAKQARLTELQIESLHEERRLTLEHLRWRAFSDRMKAILQVMVASLGLALAAGMVWMAWSASQERGLMIEPFSVPPDLAQRGLTGQVVASMLLDHLGEMQNATVSARDPSTYANNWNDEIKVQIPETGVSVGELRRLLVRWLGHQTTISGELYRTPAGLVLDARTGTAPAKGHAGGETELDALVQAAAEDVYATTQPYRYAIFLKNKGDPASVERSNAALRALAAGGDATDRLWAQVGLASGLPNPVDSIEAASQAVVVAPRFPMGYGNRAGGHAALGHDEAALADYRMAEATARSDGRRYLTPRALAYLEPGYRARVAGLLGDWRTSATEDTRSVEAQGRNEFRTGIVFEHVMAHDLAAARRVRASKAPPAATDVSPAAALERIKHIDAEALLAIGVDDWASVRKALEGSLELEGLPPGTSERRMTQDLPYLALARARTGDPAGAKALIDASPTDCHLCVRMRARIAAASGDWPSAERWFAEAVRQGPSLPLTYAEWGEARLARGDLDGAIEKLKLARAKGPHHADAAELWGEALLRKGDARGAAAKFAEADKDAPRWGRNHLRWGQALARLGKADQAKAQWRIAAGLEMSAADRAELARVMR